MAQSGAEIDFVCFDFMIVLVLMRIINRDLNHAWKEEGLKQRGMAHSILDFTNIDKSFPHTYIFICIYNI